MKRRTLFSLPLLLVLPPPAPGRLDVGEIRIGGEGASRLARALRHLPVPVRAVPMRPEPGGAERALDRGHLELALLDAAALGRAQARMGPRLVVLGRIGMRALVSRRVLGAALHARCRPEGTERRFSADAALA